MELRPLMVRGDLQPHGIGRAFVEDIARLTKARGGVTLMAGTDDEARVTELGGVDLYDDLPGRLARMGPKEDHGGRSLRLLSVHGFHAGESRAGRQRPKLDLVLAQRL